MVFFENLLRARSKARLGKGPQRRDVLTAAAMLGLAGPGLARADGPAPGPAPIAFRYRAQKIFAPALINSRPTWALIDTGARTAALSNGFAMHIGSRGRPVQVQGMNREKGVAQLHTSLSVIMGEVLMEDIHAIAIDLSPLSRVFGAEVGAVIGLDLFRRYVVGLDFAGSLMSLTPRASFAREAAGPPLPMPHANDLMSLWVQLDGGPADLATIDLGCSECLIVSADVAEGRGLLKDAKVSETIVTLADGSTLAKTATLKSVTFAGRSFSNVPVCVMPTGDHRVILGMGLLRRFDMTLDFTGQQGWMKPNAVANAGFRKDVLGLVLTPERQVQHVAPGSPAAAAGVKIGDRITGYGDEALAWRIVGPNPPLGERLVVKFADGAEKTLTTAEYY